MPDPKREPTPGALRVAKRFMGGDETEWQRDGIRKWAAYIDEETAAPDLLEACELAVKSWFSGEVSEIHMECVLRTAIAKAKGESND